MLEMRREHTSPKLSTDLPVLFSVLPIPPFPITRIPYPKKFEILSTLTSSLVKSKLLLVNE